MAWQVEDIFARIRKMHPFLWAEAAQSKAQVLATGMRTRFLPPLTCWQEVLVKQTICRKNYGSLGLLASIVDAEKLAISLTATSLTIIYLFITDLSLVICRFTMMYFKCVFLFIC